MLLLAKAFLCQSNVHNSTLLGMILNSKIPISCIPAIYELVFTGFLLCSIGSISCQTLSFLSIDDTAKNRPLLYKYIVYLLGLSLMCSACIFQFLNISFQVSTVNLLNRLKIYYQGQLDGLTHLQQFNVVFVSLLRCHRCFRS